MDSKVALERALRALEQEKKRIDNRRGELEEQITMVRGMLQGSARPSPNGRGSGSRKRGPMTAAHKRKLSLAMKRAWARRT